jgi:hypothetical protein
MSPLAHSVLARFYEGTYGRVVAFCYDGFLRGSERAGLADNRKDLWLRMPVAPRWRLAPALG